MNIGLADARGKKYIKKKNLAYIVLIRKAKLSNCPLIVSPRLAFKGILTDPGHFSYYMSAQ